MQVDSCLHRTRGDKYIWGIVVLLAITSLLVVYSATGSLAYKMYKGNTKCICSGSCHLL